jgi:NADH:ubiquinone oxidoreductase subunit 5 (subunit L)/multisubunit Na+/H+ antiporter MnhA subunit
MYGLILGIPLISSVVAGGFGRYIGERGAGIFTSTSIVITCFICWFAFIEITFFNVPSYLHL